jgi:uncharacterized protein YhaN
MKLLQLNLRAYGPFTDKILQFQNGGLHIVLGPNEAGKSTALRALHAALFGMDEKRDAHLHPWDMLRVGLKIQTLDGQVLDVERRKGKGAKSLLFTNSEKAVPVEEWVRVLPVESAEIFEQMFGLNYDRLVEGGRQLAGFKGEVGQAILAAAGDLGQTVNRMQELQDRAGEIFAARASSCTLNRAFAEYKAAEKTMRDERFSSREYKAAVSRREELGQDLEKIAEDLTRCSEDRHRLTRLQTAAPHVQRLLDDEEQMKASAGSVLLPGDFEQRFNRTASDLRNASCRKDDGESELKRLTAELVGIPRDVPMASLVVEIDRWKDLSGKIQAARVDCPRRESQCQQLRAQRDVLGAELGIEAEAVPRLSVEQRKRIESLAGKHLVLETKREELPGRIVGIQIRLGEAERILAELPLEMETINLVAQLAQIPKKKQPEAEMQRLRKERDGIAARLHGELLALPLWAGTAEQLETLGLPLSASVSEIDARFIKQESRDQQLSKEGREIVAEVVNANRRLNALELQAAIPTDSQLAEARARREMGWKAVKDQWLEGIERGPAESAFLENSNQPLPIAFERAVAIADTVADRLRREADRVEQKRSALEDQERANRRVIEHEKAVEEAGRDRSQLETEWSGLWVSSGIGPRTPREMLAWLIKRDELVAQFHDLKCLSGHVAQAEDELRGWRESLRSELGEAAECPLENLVAKAEHRLQVAAEIRTKRVEATFRKAQLQSELESVTEEQRRNDSALQEWRILWVTAIQGLPVSEVADPGAVQEVICLIDDIGEKSREIKDLQYRIGTMQRDETEYVQGVGALVVRASRDELAQTDALTAISKLQAAARAAQDNELRAAGLIETQSRKGRDLADATADVARHGASLDKLREEAQIPEVSLLPAAIQRSQQQRILIEQIKGHRKALLQSCGHLPLDVFLAQVQGTNIDMLPAELAWLGEECKRLENAKAEKTSERDAIDREFQLREAATELSKACCEKQSAAARIDALTAEYLEQQIGATLLARAMALYRTKHQDPLLKRAGEYFAALTCGGFSGLVIDQDNNLRVLKGVRAAGGAHLEVTSMSDGTRDQLFLALRVAYIENHCDGYSPCPVILDDVLMAFDDARSTAALKTLQNLSRKTQVLVFTHHAHHVLLAESVLGKDGFQLHELGS